MRLNFRHLIFALAAGAAAATQAAAFTFQPMFARLDASGPGSIQTFEVRNDGDKSLAVRFLVLFRAVGPEGKEINEDAGGLFTIYPARVVVEPRSSAAVKLQWNGPANVASERAFRLVAENVALDSAEPSASGIKVMFRYIASVYEARACPAYCDAAAVAVAVDADGRRRIVALADVFDALTSTRPYKPAFPLEKSLGILAQECGRHFDPDVCSAFNSRIDEIESIIKGANKWVKVVPNEKAATIHELTPTAVSGTLTVPIGRMRKMLMGPKYLTAFTVGDQLLWGAAEPVRRIIKIVLEHID